MSNSEHPKSLPGIPYDFPDWLDRLQNAVISPMIRRFGRFLPPFVVIEHRGRKSGTPYKAVVHGYRRGSTFAVILGHGKADWVRNILAAGEADVHLLLRDVHIVNPRVIPIGGDVSDLPWAARLGARRYGIFAADIVGA